MIATLQTAATGAGGIPWRTRPRDLEEEDRVHALLHPPDGSPGLSLAGVRALARQLRGALDAHDRHMLIAAATSRACPFDLHALIAVPSRLLALGPDDPAGLAWRRDHWGTLHALRHVTLRADPPDRRRHTRRLHYAFWAAGWSPWAALRTLQARWPSLTFDLRPDYRDG